MIYDRKVCRFCLVQKKSKGVTFLCSNKKVTKEIDLRGVECRAPARQSHPLKIPRRALGQCRKRQ